VDNDATLRRHGTAQRLAVLPAVADRPHSTADDLSTVVDRRHLTPGGLRRTWRAHRQGRPAAHPAGRVAKSIK